MSNFKLFRFQAGHLPSRARKGKDLTLISSCCWSLLKMPPLSSRATFLTGRRSSHSVAQVPLPPSTCFLCFLSSPTPLPFPSYVECREPPVPADTLSQNSRLIGGGGARRTSFSSPETSLPLGALPSPAGWQPGPLRNVADPAPAAMIEGDGREPESRCR